MVCFFGLVNDKMFAEFVFDSAYLRRLNGPDMPFRNGFPIYNDFMMTRFGWAMEGHGCAGMLGSVPYKSPTVIFTCSVVIESNKNVHDAWLRMREIYAITLFNPIFRS